LGSSPEGTEHLSQGEDSIELSFNFGVYDNPTTYNVKATYRHKFSATWNDIFAVVSPLLIDEASDRILKQALDSFAEERNLEILQEDPKLKGLSLRRFVLLDEDFNTIKVHLLALKLISKSIKKKTRPPFLNSCLKSWNQLSYMVLWRRGGGNGGSP